MADCSIVEIGINCSSETCLMLKVKPATSVHKIIKAYCEAKGLERNSLRFLFDGDRIPEGATVASLGLEQGDWYENMHCRTSYGHCNSVPKYCNACMCLQVLSHSLDAFIQQVGGRSQGPLSKRVHMHALAACPARVTVGRSIEVQWWVQFS